MGIRRPILTDRLRAARVWVKDVVPDGRRRICWLSGFDCPLFLPCQFPRFYPFKNSENESANL